MKAYDVTFVPENWPRPEDSIPETYPEGPSRKAVDLVISMVERGRIAVLRFPDGMEKWAECLTDQGRLRVGCLGHTELAAMVEYIKQINGTDIRVIDKPPGAALRARGIQ